MCGVRYRCDAWPYSVPVVWLSNLPEYEMQGVVLSDHNYYVSLDTLCHN